MSGCTIHHFKTIDRQLSREEMKKIDTWSSRFSPTPTGVTYIYHYGSFGQNEERALAKYFDAMLYVDNWGTKRLMFRFPKKLVDLEILNKFAHQDEYEYKYLKFKERGEYVIMDLNYSDEEGGDWIDEDGYPIDAYIPLREEILNGDYRSLYLGWLMTKQGNTFLEDEDYEEDEYDELEMPPIPANLQKVTSAQQNLIDLFAIDESLVKAAATVSPNATKQKTDYKKLISLLSIEEKETFLLQFVTEKAGIRMELRQRLEALGGGEKKLAFGKSPSWEELMAIAQQKQEESTKEYEIAQQKAAEAARLARIEEIKAMIPKKAAMWEEAAKHLENTYASAYDAATKIICDLREVAEYENESAAFEEELRDWVSNLTGRPGFFKRLRAKGMLQIN